MVAKSLEGYNGTLFVYGTSGSGKTYTMLGPDEAIQALSKKDFDINNIDPTVESKFGIIIRTFNDIFTMISKNLKEKKDTSYEINVQYFEIYKEKIFDLIEYTNEGISTLKHKMKTKEVEVPFNKHPV